MGLEVRDPFAGREHRAEDKHRQYYEAVFFHPVPTESFILRDEN